MDSILLFQTSRLCQALFGNGSQVDTLSLAVGLYGTTSWLDHAGPCKSLTESHSRAIMPMLDYYFTPTFHENESSHLVTHYREERTEVA